MYVKLCGRKSSVLQSQIEHMLWRTAELCNRIFATEKPRFTSAKVKIHFLHSNAMMHIKVNYYISLGLKITQIKILRNVGDVIWRLLVRNVKIIHYLTSCALQFWSNLTELFLCIVVNLTCTISRFQDGGSFQLNPLVTTGRLIILRTLVINQIRPYTKLNYNIKYIMSVVILWTMHHTSG